MAKGDVILTEAIHDDAGMDAPGQASLPPLLEFGGKVLVADTDYEVIEGECHGTRTVVVAFDSVEQAKRWYESESYQAALPLRTAAAVCNVVICTGFALGE